MSPVNTNQLTIFELVGYLFSGIYFEFIVGVSFLILYQDDIGAKRIEAAFGNLMNSKPASSLLMIAGAFILAYGLGMILSHFSLFYYYGDNHIILRWFFEEPDHYPFNNPNHKNPAKQSLAAWSEILDKFNDYKLIPKNILEQATKYKTEEKYVSWSDNYAQKQDKEVSRKARVIVDQVYEVVAFSGQFLSTLDRTASRIRFISSFILTNSAFCIFLITLVIHDSLKMQKLEPELCLLVFSLILISAKFLVHSIIYKSNDMEAIEAMLTVLSLGRALRGMRRIQQFIRNNHFLFLILNLLISKWTLLIYYSCIVSVCMYFKLAHLLLIHALLIITTLAHSEVAQKSANCYWLTTRVACMLYCDERNKQSSRNV